MNQRRKLQDSLNPSTVSTTFSVSYCQGMILFCVKISDKVLALKHFHSSPKLHIGFYCTHQGYSLNCGLVPHLHSTMQNFYRKKSQTYNLNHAYHNTKGKTCDFPLDGRYDLYHRISKTRLVEIAQGFLAHILFYLWQGRNSHFSLLSQEESCLNYLLFPNVKSLLSSP